MSTKTFIREIRESRNISLRSLADSVNVSPSYLSRVENGIVPLSSKLIHAIARELDILPDNLFLITGHMSPSMRLLLEQAPEKHARAITRFTHLCSSESAATYALPILSSTYKTAIEHDFPIEYISDIAEVESWRKEIYRPIYHQHKWWAKRLGSVFRAAILGSVLPKGSSIEDLFNEPIQLPSPVVFDPFMGGGTIVGEAHKLGCTVIGRDINPVAYMCSKAALMSVSRSKLLAYFDKIRRTVEPVFLDLYTTTDSLGRNATVLYFFWVKQLLCPHCEKLVDLFSKMIFASHAYPKKHPEAHSLCPDCGAIVITQYNSTESTCSSCGCTFNPQIGPARRAKATCPYCNAEFHIANEARKHKTPPIHRLFAKLILDVEGSKKYIKATQKDQDSYIRVSKQLTALDPPIPRSQIPDGHNTRQILNYGYSTWDQLFNHRQLYGLSILVKAIGDLPDSPERELLSILFSGVLEFNNMFASYKGEGTGAVRHMFSHHILKPERVPIEANIWGTPKSSGSFSTLFSSRLLRALDYKEAPFEVIADYSSGKLRGKKVYGLSPPIGCKLLNEFPKDLMNDGDVLLSCGDSSSTDIPSKYVDVVVTDPPFFDNVHYSELADFFYVWHEFLPLSDQGNQLRTTRRKEEVQDTNESVFAAKLGDVFSECHRVLKDEGILVFSYHHSRENGWTSVAKAVQDAGFSFVNAQPVKSEMASATPKSQTKSPIDLDVLLVCRKSKIDIREIMSVDCAVSKAYNYTIKQVTGFLQHGRLLSDNDIRIILYSNTLVQLSAGRESSQFNQIWQSELGKLSGRIAEIRSLCSDTLLHKKHEHTQRQLSLDI